MVWRIRSKRKSTGGLLRRPCKKKKFQRGRDFLPMHLHERKVIENRTRGGSKKLITLSDTMVNVSSKGKIQKVKIISVAENSADSQFVRRNIATKGAILQTEIGKARVTSRPGQHGIVNAILIGAEEMHKPEAKHKSGKAK